MLRLRNRCRTSDHWWKTLCRYGVGGEYPMAAGSAAERAESGGITKARARGREVVLTFTMQVRPRAIDGDGCSGATDDSRKVSEHLLSGS